MEMTEPPDLFLGERVRLTVLDQPDLPTIAEWQRDSRYLRLLDANLAKPKTSAELDAWLAASHKDGVLFAVRKVEFQDLIGFVHIDSILWNQRVAWLAMALGPRYWGQGYGTEALDLTIRYAFTEMNLRRLQLTVFANNLRAVRLYERVGFQLEGRFRQFLERDRTFEDMLLYGLLQSDWDNRFGDREASGKEDPA